MPGRVEKAASPTVELSAAELTIGRVVTLSPNKATGDRSLVNVLWKIVAVDGGHLLLSCRGLGQMLQDPTVQRLVAVREHDFYAADHLAAALDQPTSTH